MRKLIMFFTGLVLLALSFIALYVSGAIYDAGTNLTIQPYFFQPNNLSERRVGKPLTAEEIGDSKFMDMLVRKYVNEYFYAAPDSENIAQRTRNDSTLARSSSAKVFDEWLTTEGQTIKNLAENKSLRTVRVIDELYKPKDSDYWILNYELKTWPKPNDFSIIPETNRGTLYMKILYQPGMRTDVSLETIHDFLENGGDPARVFQFQVQEVIQG